MRRKRLLAARRVQPFRQRAMGQVGTQVDGEGRIETGVDRITNASGKGVDCATLKASLRHDGFAPHRLSRKRQSDSLERLACEFFTEDCRPFNRYAAIGGP